MGYNNKHKGSFDLIYDGSPTDVFHFTPEELAKDQDDGHFTVL